MNNMEKHAQMLNHDHAYVHAMLHRLPPVKTLRSERTNSSTEVYSTDFFEFVVTEIQDFNPQVHLNQNSYL